MRILIKRPLVLEVRQSYHFIRIQIIRAKPNPAGKDTYMHTPFSSSIIERVGGPPEPGRPKCKPLAPQASSTENHATLRAGGKLNHLLEWQPGTIRGGHTRHTHLVLSKYRANGLNCSSSRSFSSGETISSQRSWAHPTYSLDFRIKVCLRTVPFPSLYLSA
jgi:hypothetical protein